MTVSVASFLIAFPSFVKTNTAQIEAQLAMAELETSDSFGESRDLAVMLRLAHELSLDPAGRDARLAPKGVDHQFSSTYGLRLLRLQEANAVSASRLGSPEVC
jgi:hypothetical protein